MTQNDYSIIRGKILEIVREESSDAPNWPRVDDLVDQALLLINQRALEPSLDGYIIKYLDDTDIRKSDRAFGDYQRRMVRRAIDRMDCVDS